ncbi:S8 family serine peptidase [Sutcliffiella horikoshii]|uniref:S8 family peptidase n=1 Tax=Sutcliffiella horikoshii TaxID=79883 RepID=UPI00384A6DED
MNQRLTFILPLLFISLISFIFAYLNTSFVNPSDNTTNIKKSHSTIKLAILDSGINNDFNVVKRFNTFDTELPVEDDYGHGTAIASIVTNNFRNESIEIYDVKVLNEKGNGDIEQLINGIEWAMNQSVDIINISLGTHSNNKRLETVIKKALQEDIIIIASSGNNYGLYVDYPARYKGVISVSSLKDNNEKVFDSEVGKIDVVDYGLEIEAINRTGKIEKFSGTSFATANVTKKIIALIQADFLSNSNKNLLESLERLTIDLGEKGKDAKFGVGLIKNE